MTERPFDPERTLFVDDSEYVLEAAEAYAVTNLMTLKQPDSSVPPRQSTRYPRSVTSTRNFQRASCTCLT